MTHHVLLWLVLQVLMNLQGGAPAPHVHPANAHVRLVHR
jgi:hypothetical protein